MTEWKAVAVYDFKSTNEVELELKKGDVVTIRRKSVGDGWWEGERNGIRGLIPMKFVRKMSENTLNEEGSVTSVVSNGSDVGKHDSDGDTHPEEQQKNSSRPSTPRGSKKALMENLMIPDVVSAFDPKKAKEIFTDNSTVQITSGPSWDLSSRQSLHVVIRNPSIQQHSTFGAPHIFYEVETKELNVVVSRRYRHFLWLYDKLADLFPCICLPPLPVKQGSGNVEAHFIESRRRALERFVQRVAKHPALGNSRALHDFLTIKDSKDWKIGSKSSTFSLTRNSMKRLFAPAVYSAIVYPPHNYAVSQLSSIEEFAQFAKMIDSNMSPIRQSCLDMSSRSGDMSNTLQQLGKDLSRFTRGEEPSTQSLPQSQKKTSSSNTHHAHYRSAAELEEDREPVVGDWAWQGNKSFHGLLVDIASVARGIESVARLCYFQQDMLEQLTASMLQDYSGILHAVPGIVKIHEEAMKAYNISKEKDSKKDAELMKTYCESLNNIVLAEINYVHDQILSDMKEMLSELLAREVDYHQMMAKGWSDLHSKFLHKSPPKGTDVSDGTSECELSSSAHTYMNMVFGQPGNPPTDTGTTQLQNKQTDKVPYDIQRMQLAKGGLAHFPALSLSPTPKEKRGYEFLTETLGGRGLSSDQKSHSYGDIRSRDDDVYVPFTPGKPPLDHIQKKKAADYTPFVPLSERKSDPGLLDHEAEPKAPHGYLSFVPINQQPGGLEAFLREERRKEAEEKPGEYLTFTPVKGNISPLAVSVSEGVAKEINVLEESESSTVVREEPGVVKPKSELSQPDRPLLEQKSSNGHKSSHLPPQQSLVVGGDTSSIDSNESGPHPTASSIAPTDENSRHQPVAVKNSYSSEMIPLQTSPAKTKGEEYIRRKVEAGDSSASSSGESSPSPRIRSVISDTVAGNMSWNNNNSNNTKRSTTESNSVDTTTVGQSSGPKNGILSNCPSEADTESASSHVADLIQRFQAQPKLKIPGRKLDEHALRRQRSAIDSTQRRMVSPSNTPRRKSSDSSVRRRLRKENLESLGIIEDKNGGSFAV